MTFTGIFDNIPGNVWRHSLECLRKFSRMFGDYLLNFGNIPQNVWGHSLECSMTLSRMFSDIHWNVWQHFGERLATFSGI